MDITPLNARRISIFAWTMAAVGTVVGQVHAIARALSHPGDWEDGGPSAAWGRPAAKLLRPLLDWSDPWTVYVTYGKIWTPVCVAFTLAAWLTYQRRRPRGLERRLWQVNLVGYALMTVSVIGDYFTPQWMDVMFVAGVFAMLVMGVAGIALGIVLLRNGFRPRVTAILLIAFFPLLFVITEVTSLGSALLPLMWGWAIAAHAVVRADRLPLDAPGPPSADPHSPSNTPDADVVAAEGHGPERTGVVQRSDLQGRSALARSLVATGMAAAVLQVTPATAQADASPAQRFDVGFRLVDGQPVRLTLVASGTAKGRGTVTEDYVPAPDGTWHVLATFHLPSGTVVVSAEAGQLQRVFRPQACQASGRMHIPYTVVGGTGAYEGATGGGWLTEHQNLVGERVHGVCQGPDSGLPPALVVGRIVAEGTLALR